MPRRYRPGASAKAGATNNETTISAQACESGTGQERRRKPERPTMKRLILLRHAKAVPAESGIEDFDRTLMLIGMQDAGAMARYLGKSDYAVDLILCSAAARTVQTAELMLQELVCEIEYRDNLYLAEPAKI